jgi:ribosomal protein L9
MATAKKTDTATKTRGQKKAAPEASTKSETKAAAKPKALSATAKKKAIADLTSAPKAGHFQTVAGHVEKLDAKTALELIPTINEGIDTAWFALGGVIARILEENWWKDSGHANFNEFIEQEHGIDNRTARYWATTYVNLIRLEITHEQLTEAKIGWSKLKEIAKVMTHDTIDEWFKRAQELSLRELISYIKALKEDGDKSKEKDKPDGKSDLTKVKFDVHADQLQSLNSALEKAQGITESEFGAVNLTQICDAYNADFDPDKVSVSMADQMKSAGWEATLQAFAEVFPGVDLEVTAVNE